MMRRGRSSAAVSSSSVRAPVKRAPLYAARNLSTHSVSRFQTATGMPRDSMFSARLRPIVPRPTMPNADVAMISFRFEVDGGHEVRDEEVLETAEPNSTRRHEGTEKNSKTTSRQR